MNKEQNFLNDLEKVKKGEKGINAYYIQSFAPGNGCHYDLVSVLDSNLKTWVTLPVPIYLKLVNPQMDYNLKIEELFCSMDQEGVKKFLDNFQVIYDDKFEDLKNELLKERNVEYFENNKESIPKIIRECFEQDLNLEIKDKENSNDKIEFGDNYYFRDGGVKEEHFIIYYDDNNEESTNFMQEKAISLENLILSLEEN